MTASSTAVQPIYDRYGQGHTGPPAPERESVNPAIRQSLRQDRRFVDVEVHSYDWNQTYTASAYRKLMLSYSGTQMMDPGDRQGLLDDIEAFIQERFSGQITRPLVVTLTTATLRLTVAAHHFQLDARMPMTQCTRGVGSKLRQRRLRPFLSVLDWPERGSPRTCSRSSPGGR